MTTPITFTFRAIRAEPSFPGGFSFVLTDLARPLAERPLTSKWHKDMDAKAEARECARQALEAAPALKGALVTLDMHPRDARAPAGWRKARTQWFFAREEV
jgi:hypothetical protein